MTREISDTYNLFFTQSPDGSRLITAIQKPNARPIALTQCYSHVAEICETMGLQIAQERFWGDLDTNTQRTALRARNEIFSDAVPPVFLEGSPAYGPGIAGIQLRAVPRNSASPIFFEGRVAGMQWEYANDRFAILTGVCGSGRNSSSETLSLLQNVNTILSKTEFEVANITRTWFYLDNILDWYDDFNAVRTTVYRDWGLVPDDQSKGLRLPASTGIGVCNGFSKSLTVDLFLARRLNGQISQLSNTGQKDAYEYGSAFSRGALLPFDTGTLLELSGTASISESGDTVFLNDAEAQIHCTMNKIDALIHPLGISIDNLATGVAFFRNAQDVRLFDQHCESRGLKIDDLPIICVQADVCRSDLLFEMDGELVTKVVAKAPGS